MTATSLSTTLLLLAASLVPSPGMAEDCGQLREDNAQSNAGCLLVQGSHLLMIQQNFNKKWSLPGGGKLDGERAVCTAHRETLEETGLNVQVKFLIHDFSSNFRLYLCEADTKVPLSPTDSLEVKRAAWLSSEERQSIRWRFPDQQPYIEKLVKKYGN